MTDYAALAKQLGGAPSDAPATDYAALAKQFGGTAAKQAEEKYDPTEGMSGFEKVAAGAGKAAVDLYRGIKQLTGIGDQGDLQREIDESKRLDEPLMRTGGGLAGNIAMNFGLTAVPGGALVRGAKMIPGAARVAQAATASRPFLTALGAGAGAGAATSALGPVASDETRAGNAAMGAAGGALGGAVARGAGRVLTGKSVSGADELIDAGVRVTPGRAMGGAAQRLEEGMESVPVLGDVIKKSHRRSVEDFNRAAVNKALEPIAAKLEKGEPVGREAIGKAESLINDAYERVLGKIKLVKLDNEFADDLGKLSEMADTLPEGAAKQFEKIVDKEVFRRMTPAGTMSADTMKVVESELGRLGRGYRASQEFDKRQLGDAILEVQASLRGAVERSAGPEVAGELKNVNRAFAQFVRIQKAASSVAAEDGVFSPAQLLSAVKASDKSVRKGAFARGDALLQDFAENAKTVLGPKVPDSGSPYRLMAGLGGLGGAGAFFDVDPANAGLLALLAAPYTRAGRAATLAALSRRPDAVRQLGGVFQRGAPYAGIAGGYMGLPAAE